MPPFSVDLAVFDLKHLPSQAALVRARSERAEAQT